VWYNNVTQSPYPGRIKAGALVAVNSKATSNILVNGQTFKDFLLNISASAACAWDPIGFDPEQFYTDWTTRYFGKNASAKTVEVLKLTYQANVPLGGFRNTMNKTVQILNTIEKKNPKLESLEAVETSIKASEQALKLVHELAPTIEGNKRMSFTDQIAYPTEIFNLNLLLLKSALVLNNSLVNELSDPASVKQKSEELKKSLIALRKKLTNGSGWEKWENFYNPENFRIHTPPPSIERVDNLLITR
jgi:hypothetical protein